MLVANLFLKDCHATWTSLTFAPVNLTTLTLPTTTLQFEETLIVDHLGTQDLGFILKVMNKETLALF